MQATYKMKSYCSKGRKYTENINPKVSRTSNGKAKISSKCATSDIKKSRFIKNQDAKGLLSNLGLRTPLSKVAVLGDNLFWMQFYWSATSLNRIKMIEIVNKFLLAGDKFMPEMPLKQREFTYSACGPFTKNKERI